jgi:uncharacterized CHY-type Zn-finger protein
MSDFISSLLIQIGIRSPDLPPPRLQPHHAEHDLNEPSHNDPPSTAHPGHCCGQKSVCGDAGAGSMHSSPFFTSLPKEMDGRNLQHGTPSVNHSTPGPIRNMAATDGLSDPIQETDVSPQPISGGISASHPGEAVNLQNAPQDTTSAIPIERARMSVGNAFDLERLVQSSLPADDGMGVLRSKIIAIRDQQLANAEKARMVHDLMTESYNSSRDHRNTPGSRILSAPTSPPILGMPMSPRTRRVSESQAPELGSASFDLVPPYESLFNLTPEDLQPTFVPKTEAEAEESAPVETGDEDLDTEELAEATLGCVHYHRNVKLECHTCKKWYTCRFCHDEAEDHALIRRDTENMLCMLCGHAQPAGQNCRKCEEQTAQYYCDICKLWDNDSKKSIYHCDDCGICRIGQGLGKDFFHCQVSAPRQRQILMRLNNYRRALFAFLCLSKTPIVASSVPLNATVRSAVIICSLLPKLSSSCDVVTAYIPSA